MTKIAFIGLGMMGLPMAANLAKAGHDVAGHDLSASAMEAAGARGVRAAASGAEAAREAAVVITMLPSGEHLKAAYGVLLSAASPGALFIDCSTVDIASARAAHEAAEGAGMVAVDAPVSGGVGGAEAATLTFMVGGEEAAVARARDALSLMGKRVIHCGGPGAGQAAKICNNMILGVSMIAVGEAFVLGEKLGLSHQALFDVASTSSGQCWSLTSYCPVPGPIPASPANNEYRPGFATRLMLKDLRLSQDAATAAGARTDLGRHAMEIYEAFDRAGAGGLDFSAIIQALREARSGEPA